MNLLVITREIPPVGGGAGHVAIHLAQEMVRRGHRVTIVTMHFDGLAEHEPRGGIEIWRVRCGRRHQDSSYVPEMCAFLLRGSRLGARLMRRQRFDLVHAHSILPDGRMGLRAARGRVPVVATAHGSDVPGYNPERFQLVHRLARPLWQATIRRLAAVVAPSHHLAGLIRAARPGQHVHVIPNGIDVDLFDPSRPRKDAFLIVSRLVRRKNYHLFLEALGRIHEPQEVHIVGEGPELEALRRQAAALAGHRVVFHGWLANGSPQWKELYETCRWFVLPSESENFPVNLLEAQLAGLVVLASDIPGSREVLGDCAVYFDRLEPEAMAAVIRRVLADRQATATLAARGRQRVVDNFSWPAVAGRYLSVYEAVLQAAQRAAGDLAADHGGT